MRKIAVLFVIGALLLPVGCLAGDASGAGGRYFPPLPPLPPILTHQDVEVLSNFSSMSRFNLELRDDGALELSRGGSYTAFDEVRLWQAAAADPLPDVAVDRFGQSIAVWDDWRGGNVDVFIQRFYKGGGRLGPEMHITGPKDSQSGAVVDVTSTGGFVVAYQAKAVSDLSVYAQRYDANGTPLGGVITVSVPTGGGAFPDIVVDSNDGFIITWWDERSGNGDIFARRYDAAGNQLGSEIEVYTGASEDQVPCIALLPGNGFVIAWSSINTPSYDIMAQRFSASGGKLGSAIQVNALPHDGRFPDVCANSQGEFTVAFDRINTSEVYFQRFDKNGAKLGGEVKSPGPAGDAFEVHLAATSGDGFVMVWEIELSGINAETFLQRYDRSGNKVGAAMQLSKSVVYGVRPKVAVGPGDSFSVLWQNFSAWDNKTITMRLVARPHAPSGWVMTGPIAPGHLWSWLNLAASATYEDAAQNSISYEWSSDNGSTWTDIAANGSLSGAGNATPIRVKATLSTDLRTTTPALSALKLSYKFDQLPAVSLPAGFNVPLGDPVLVLADAADPDDLFLSFKWVQTAGPPAAFCATSRNLSFSAAAPGLCSFTLTASDGFGAGPPASIDITVFERPPDIELSAQNVTLAPARPKAGATVTISARILNLGLSGTGPFKVRFLLDCSTLEDQDVGGLAQNASVSVNISWRARAGTHALKVTTDFDNRVNESREDNNEAETGFKVASSSAKEVEFPWWLLVAVLVLAGAAVAAVLYMKRRGRPATVIQYKPPEPVGVSPAATVPPVPAVPPVPPVRPASAPAPLDAAPAIPPAVPQPQAPPQATPSSGAQIAWDRPAPPAQPPQAPPPP